MKEFAILAPVPLEQIEAAQQVAAHTGFVAFGSRKPALFRQAEAWRGGEAVPIMMYPAHEGVPTRLSVQVSWTGWYIGCEETSNGKHSGGMEHRPLATDTKANWAVFWHVSVVIPLAPTARFPISRLGTVRGSWCRATPLCGPELVARPDFIDIPDPPITHGP